MEEVSISELDRCDSDGVMVCSDNPGRLVELVSVCIEKEVIGVIVVVSDPTDVFSVPLDTSKVDCETCSVADSFVAMDERVVKTASGVVSVFGGNEDPDVKYDE